MSRKNTKTIHGVWNGYPLPSRTVLYSHKKRLQPIPEIGKKYHCFDDGKITPSRHYIIQVDEVLGHNAFKRKYPEWFEQYLNVSKDCYWLYSRSSDKFIVTHKGENDKLGVFSRTKQGGWFGIGNLWNCGLLDVSNKKWNYLINHINDFDYATEEMESFIKENTI